MKALTSSAHKIAFCKIFFYAEKRESIAIPFLCVNVFTYDNTAQRNIPLKTIFYSPLSFKHTIGSACFGLPFFPHGDLKSFHIFF